MIRKNLVNIVNALKSAPGSKRELSLHYKEHQWLDIAAYPEEDELVTLALARIEHNPSQYDLFVHMLQKVKGMDLVVNAITKGELHDHGACSEEATSFSWYVCALCASVCINNVLAY